MISHTMSVAYALQPGWMAPFITALQAGDAVARHCAACGTTSFPPQRTCTCGSADGTWVPLPGTAEIRFRTRGADGDFALAQFDGADTLAVVSLCGIAPDQTRGRCIAGDGALPKMRLGPMDGGA